MLNTHTTFAFAFAFANSHNTRIASPLSNFHLASTPLLHITYLRPSNSFNCLNNFLSSLSAYTKSRSFPLGVKVPTSPLLRSQSSSQSQTFKYQSETLPTSIPATSQAFQGSKSHQPHSIARYCSETPKSCSRHGQSLTHTFPQGDQKYYSVLLQPAGVPTVYPHYP